MVGRQRLETLAVSSGPADSTLPSSVPTPRQPDPTVARPGKLRAFGTRPKHKFLPDLKPHVYANIGKRLLLD
jgi:hypothetical protein